jgi:hypothetical protein
MEETEKGETHADQPCRVQFNHREQVGRQHNPVAIYGFQSFEKGEEIPFPPRWSGAVLGRRCRILQGEEKGRQLSAVVRVEMTEKEMGNLEYGDADFQQAAHGPRSAVKKQVFPTGLHQQ